MKIPVRKFFVSFSTEKLNFSFENLNLIACGWRGSRLAGNVQSKVRKPPDHLRS